MLSQSATKKVPPAPVREIPEPVASTPPIKRLMSALQDSLNWSKSTISDIDHSRSVKPSMASSVMSGASAPQKPLGLSFLGMDNGSYSSTSIDSSSGMFVDTTEISDNVFLTDHSHGVDTSNCSDSVCMSVDKTNDCLTGSCSCKTSSATNKSCSECKSHVKAPSRQETMTDETPQMHRTDESVWNSYAAKNLRSLREGEEFSGDSDSFDVDKENMEFSSSIIRTEKPVLIDFQRKCAVKNIKPRKLVKTKSFSYPSDDESDTGSFRRYKGHKRFARKRTFQDVAQSPIHRAHSADSGLTQEFRLFHLEPCSKRSNSFPRTRIRFHSESSDTESKESKDKNSSSMTNVDSLPKENLKKIVAGLSTIAESEKLSKLFGDEKRQNDNMSVVLEMSHSMSCKTNNCDTNMQNDFEEKSEHENVKEGLQESNMDLFDSVESDAQKTKDSIDSNMDLFHDVKVTAQKTKDSVDCLAPLHNRVAALKGNMVSSVKSEGDLKMAINSDLSSIHEYDLPSCITYDEDTSVFTSAVDSSWDNKLSLSTEFLPEKEIKKESPVAIPPTKLLPPPPPKKRVNYFTIFLVTTTGF